MKTFITLISIFITCSILALSPDHFKWQPLKEKEGVRVYRAQRHEKTGIVPIKAESVVNFSVARILTVATDTKRKTEWVPKLLHSEVVEYHSKMSRVEYGLYDSPWPFNDRDFIILAKGKILKEKREFHISIHSIKHPKKPKYKGYVRGHTYIGNVYLKELGPNQTRVEIVLLTDFGGFIPAWIINMVQKKWPHSFFKNIRNRLADKNVVTNKEYENIFQ